MIFYHFLNYLISSCQLQYLLISKWKRLGLLGGLFWINKAVLRTCYFSEKWQNGKACVVPALVYHVRLCYLLLLLFANNCEWEADMFNYICMGSVVGAMGNPCAVKVDIFFWRKLLEKHFVWYRKLLVRKAMFHLSWIKILFILLQWGIDEYIYSYNLRKLMVDWTYQHIFNFSR